MKKLLVVCIFLHIAAISSGQNKLLEQFNRIFPDDTSRRNTFMPLPAVGYNQEAGFIVGAAGLYSFYMDKHDYATRPSQINGMALVSTKGQTQFSLKSDIWSKQNKWHHIHTIQFYHIPFNFYGVGNDTRTINEDKLKQEKIRINSEVEYKFFKNYYAGLGAEFESHSFTDKEAGGIFESLPLVDQKGGKFLMFKISQLYDTRNSNTYPTKGFFGRLKYGYTPNFFGQDNFSGSFYSADIRQFVPLHKKVVFASKLFYEGLDSDRHIPFYVLRQLGNDEVMRGYYQGRYRDEQYISLQSEIRYRFSNRFGIVAFGGLGNVDNKFSNLFSDLKPNYGLGGRFFFDLDKSLAIRFDYGFGEKPAGEKRISGFYISLSEAF